jgi:hypothetical protein
VEPAPPPPPPPPAEPATTFDDIKLDDIKIDDVNLMDDGGPKIDLNFGDSKEKSGSGLLASLGGWSTGWGSSGKEADSGSPVNVLKRKFDYTISSDDTKGNASRHKARFMALR